MEQVAKLEAKWQVGVACMHVRFDLLLPVFVVL